MAITRNKTKEFFRMAAIMSFLPLVYACTGTNFFSEFHSFPQSKWNQSEIIRLEVPVADVSKHYDVYLEIRNNNQYSFRNLWLFIDVKMADGTVRNDTISIPLADIYGKWFGTGIGTYSLAYLYKSDFQYPEAGTYVYTIRQGMRSEVLNGISEVGLRIETQYLLHSEH